MSDNTQVPVIFPSKEVANAVINIVSGKKPPGWGKKSRSSYYSRFYAEQIKKQIDLQLESGRDIFYHSSIFCEGPSGITLHTLYSKINQSIRFLCDRMDNDNKYRKWYDSVFIRREKDGLRISLRPKFDSIEPMLVVPRHQMSRWRREFDEWLESNTEEPFVRDSLALTNEEIREFNAELEGLKTVMGMVTSSTIKVLRVERTK
jgi:hypothetical protein